MAFMNSPAPQSFCSSQLQHLFQETHVSSESKGKHWKSEWGSQAIFSPGPNAQMGSASLSTHGPRLEIANHRVDQSGRIVSAKIHQLDAVTLTRGVRMGCTLSPLLYCLVLETSNHPKEIKILGRDKGGLLHWVPNLGDPEYQAKWAYFGRYWLSLTICKLMPDWCFLRDNSRPK